MPSEVRLASPLTQTKRLVVACRLFCDLVCKLVYRKLRKVIVHGGVHHVTVEAMRSLGSIGGFQVHRLLEKALFIFLSFHVEKAWV